MDGRLKMMTKRVTKNKTLVKNPQRSLHLKLAYNLGRTVKNVSKTVSAVKNSGKVRPRFKKEPMPPILKEIKAIADISGLTAALEEMNEISLKHSRHPVITQLTSKIEQLSMAEKEMLSRKFIEKLASNPCFNNSAYAFPAKTKITEEDCQRISDAFIESVFYALEDVGMTPREREFLQKFSDDMTRPINDLVQFYLNPKTFSQKVKRLWRMQRILIKMIKLIHMTNAMSQANGGAFRMDVVPQGGFSSNHWPLNTAAVKKIALNKN